MSIFPRLISIQKLLIKNNMFDEAASNEFRKMIQAPGTPRPDQADMLVRKTHDELAALSVGEQAGFVEQRKHEIGIVDGLDIRFAALCQDLGYKIAGRDWPLKETSTKEQIEHIRDPNDFYYPSPEEWVIYRILNDRYPKFAPVFVTDTDGNVLFIKLQISHHEKDKKLIETEASFLSKLNLDTQYVSSPRYITSGTYEGQSYYVTEAINFSEASIKEKDEISPEDYKRAARAISDLERTDNIVPDDQSQNSEQKKQQVVHTTADMLDRFTHSAVTAESLTPHINQLTQVIAEAATLPERFAHGDLNVKNILWSDIDEKIILVDWENAQLAPAMMNLYQLGVLSLPEDKAKALFQEYMKNSNLSMEEVIAGLKFYVVQEMLGDIQWRFTHYIDKNVQVEEFTQEIVTSIIPDALTNLNSVSDKVHALAT